MKNINIKKSITFQNTSKIYVFVGLESINKRIWVYTIPINEGENIIASHLWTAA